MKTLSKLLIIMSFAFLYSCGNNDTTQIKEDREQHEAFLDIHPFNQTIQLSREDRKKQGLPPNAYYEREYLLTMNPSLGRPTPEKVKLINKDLEIAKSVPGNSRSWEDRGPNNIGGRTHVVFFDPNDVGPNNGDGIDYNRAFAGGVGGGLWVNEDVTDANSSWTTIPGVASNLNVSCYAIDPNDPLTMYIGTGEIYTSGAAVGNGLYKTTDGGLTWNEVPIPAASGTDVTVSGNLFKSGIFYVTDVIVRNVNGTSEVYVGIGGEDYVSPNFNISNPNNTLGAQNAGLYRSTDAGSNWTRVDGPLLRYTANGDTYYVIPNDFAIAADNELYFGTIGSPINNQGAGRVYRSTNGTTWLLADVIPGADRVELAASKTNSNLFYVAVQTGSNQGDLYITTDDFATLNPMNEPNDADVTIPATDFTRGQAFYDLVIEVDPNNDQIIYAGGIDSFRSTDGGNSWRQISKWTNGNGLSSIPAPFVHADIHAISFRPGNSNEGLIGSDGGCSYVSSYSSAPTNVNVIQNRNNNLNITQFYYAAIDENGAAGGDDFVGGTQDNGTLRVNNAQPGANSFIEAVGGDGAHADIDGADGYVVVSTQYNNHRYYTYPGYSFRYCITSPNCGDNAGGTGDFINVAELDKVNNYLFANSRTFNGSNGIEVCELFNSSSNCNTITNTQITSDRPTAMKASPFANGNPVLYVGTERSNLYRVSNITTTPVWNNIRPAGLLGSVSDIEFGATEQEIYLTMHNYGVNNIYYTNDGGTTWDLKDGDLPDIPVKTILPNPLLPGEVLIGTELGVYTSSNFNSTSPNWIPAINGMTNVKVVDLDYRASDNTVLAATHGRGLFTGTLDTASITDSNEISNEIFVTPTVSNGTFSIHSELENTYDVKLHDLNGRRVWSKENMTLSKQGSQVQLNLKSGYYILSAYKDNIAISTKLLIK
ncbi:MULTISPECIES: T9SS type A sorting domain-containing protein [Nonlabens]|uniref:T9SS type A sorting domain-containing protein n=1 Tax=Nonlabens TaxID=363408 RepID=UPI000CF38FE5|nr:T9SS type A sorting domain-containing protein [Nonlabens tegetincola]PQJ18955.1 glycosyl hydrolase [Nonlabens tegetincola]